MQVVKFAAEHLKGFTPQQRQAMDIIYYDDNIINFLITYTDAYTVLANDDVIACGGLIDQRFGRATLWSLISLKARPYFYALTKEVQRRLALCDFNRVEIIVADGFEQAHRWARMLGFKLETPDGMEAYILGEKHFLYGRKL